MDFGVSPPSSARSCSSIASDLIEEDRSSSKTLSLSLANSISNTASTSTSNSMSNAVMDRLNLSMFKRRGSATSTGTGEGEHSEDYDMDMVLDNFFNLHNEIDDIESSLTNGSPKVSPRLEEYPVVQQRQSVQTSNTAMYRPPEQYSSNTEQGHSVSNGTISENTHLVMNLVSGSTGGSSDTVQLIPGDEKSKQQLLDIHNKQRQMSQHRGRLRKKTITLQVSISVFDSDNEEEERSRSDVVKDIKSETFATLTTMPPPKEKQKKSMASKVMKSLEAPAAHSKSPTGRGKVRDRGKDKGKKNNQMRHIYKTNCNAYRVQMSVGSKVNPNGKFSRNTREEKDALWLCEFAILFIHLPSTPEYLFQWGNFDYLIEFGYCSGYDDYVASLIREFVDLTSRSLIKPAEFENLRGILSSFFPTLQRRIEALDLDEIVRNGKKKKKSKKKVLSTASSISSDDSVNKESHVSRVIEGASSSTVSSPKTGKVIIPVLQLPTGSVPMLPLPSSVSISPHDVETKADSTMSIHSLFQTQFNQQTSEVVATTNTNNCETIDDTSEDVDSKRRRVPAHNPTHQSPRTLEMFQQMQR